MKRHVMLIDEQGGPLRAAEGAPPVPVVVWLNRSVLDPRPDTIRAFIDDALRCGSRPILWSGSHAQLDGGDLFDDDPRTWGPKGWKALEGAIRALGKRAHGLALRPHARHVVSDVPGCRKLIESGWARERATTLLYDPVSMCDPSPADPARAADLLRRAFEAIELFPPESLLGVVGASLGGGGGAGGPLNQLVERLARQHVPETVPLVIPVPPAASA